MKRLLVLSICGLVLCCAAPVLAWGPGAHGAISNRILEDAAIAYEVGYWGLSNSSISSEAYWGDVNMPSSLHDGQWSNMATESAFGFWLAQPVNNTYAGWLMHNIGDVSVPACHSPANEVYCDHWFENLFESQCEAYSTPGWPDPVYYYANWWEYNNYNEYHHQEIRYQAQRFKDHNNSHWSCKYWPHICQTDWIDPDCRRAAFRLGWNVFWWFLAYHS